MELRELQNGEVVLYDGRFNYWAIDGTPYGCSPDVMVRAKRVGHVAPKSVFAWQEDPGLYGPFYVKAVMGGGLVPSFTAGGSVVFLRMWAVEHNVVIRLVSCHSDRNVARTGVDWEA